ncbi:hypothetical protein GSY74_06510 [Sulfurovum sp. bin170]|uniref:hypothetical protein n=1 Tax=Sulfurovum sp. bin170 TaxID=2695268 RepID=UPI0013DF0853|nr:hypothetical protein [Sulfurovum sp. bin170]NEW60932.1 hypothetical protein [Sulfurovum sp. bin170]
MVNSIINIFKYPVAILSFLLFLELGTVFFKITYSMIEDFVVYQNFFIGMGAYFIIWFVLFRNRIGRLLLILEHEITHTIFALISFNKIIEIRAHMVGGYMRYMGTEGRRQGNWLIDVSPYFFSTLGVAVIGIIHISSPTYYPILMGILGYTLVHHVYNVIISFHPRQSDIVEVGLPFSFLFLPSANLAMIIIMLTQIPGDKIYLGTVIDYLYDSATYYGDFLLSLLK